MDKDTLTNKVTRRLIALFASGHYPDNEPLPAERKFAEQIGVSRGTLRKALEQLQQMGVVEIRPGSGAYVRQGGIRNVAAKFNPAGVAKVSLKDMMTARKAIEMAAVPAAVEKMNDSQVADLQKIVSDMAYHAEDLPRFISLDMEFHKFLVEASGNPVLIAAYEAIDEYHRYLHVVTTQNEECEQLSLAYHLRIAAAVARGDAESAARVLAEHLDNVVDQMK